jgi:hypothetical protein
MSTQKTFARTARPTRCPWHRINSTHEIAPGIWSVSTESHGGILISAERRAAMPAHLRDIPTFAGGNAYEEDCDAGIILVAFPEYFPADYVENARLSLMRYDREPREWETGQAYYVALRAAAQFIKQHGIPQAMQQTELSL